MKKIFSFMIFNSCLLFVRAQTIIAADDFETVALNPPFIDQILGAVTQTGTTGATDEPPLSTYAATGLYGLRSAAGTVVITSKDFNTTAYTGITFSMRLAAFGIGTGQGLDASDYIQVQVSPDGGNNYYFLGQVAGNSDAAWNFQTATGVASFTYNTSGSVTNYQPAGGGTRTADGYSIITITGLPQTTNLKFIISMNISDAATERWVIDNITLTAAGTLPITCKLFSVSNKNNKVKIDWIATCSNVSGYFEVERSSDGSNYIAFQKLSATGTDETSYSVTDNHPFRETSYYRLKMVDVGNKITYSKIARIKITQSGLALNHVFPNPVINQLNIEWNGKRNGDAQLIINDAAGKIITKAMVVSKTGFNQHVLQLPKLGKGQYVLQLLIDGEIFSVQFSKQ